MRDAASEFFRAFSHNAGHGQIDRFIKVYLDEWNVGVTYKAGLRELLAQLRNSFTLGLVSNTNFTPLVLGHLEAMGVLDLFSVVITSVDFGVRKPHPSIFEEALAQLGVDRNEALYIGDNPLDDYLGAERANMRCLLIDPMSVHDVAVRDRISSVFDLARMLPNSAIG